MNIHYKVTDNSDEMGLTDEQEDSFIEAHTETVDDLKKDGR